MEYRPRIQDDELAFRLECSGAVLIEGPKWCGKTTIAEHHAKSVLKKQGYLQTAETKPSLLLAGKNPRLIDEWQEAPVLWDAVRVSIDSRNETGLYILTGSNSVDKSKISHSGTGRIARMKLETMSLFETGESNGKISLSELFKNPNLEIEAKSDLEIEQIIFSACRGGWPGFFARKSERAQLQIARDYIDSVCETDISTVDGVKRNPLWAAQILRSYARNISTLAKESNMLFPLLRQFPMTHSLLTFRHLKGCLSFRILKHGVLQSAPQRQFVPAKSGNSVTRRLQLPLLALIQNIT